MKIFLKIIQYFLFRSNISHQSFNYKVDNFFDILEYQSITKKNLEDKRTIF